MNDYDERFEPGYDPGPSLEDGPWGDCDCGAEDGPLVKVDGVYMCEDCADYPDDPDPRYGDEDDRSEFADPGGNSALRAATDDNPRNLPCPNCGGANRLTPADKARGYQCDPCADRAERGGY
jgi:hypothetical protein